MIENLKKVMKLPKNPIDTGSLEKWQEVEHKMGIDFPHDYKEFISAYGTGRIGDFLWILNPFSKNENVNILEVMNYFQWAYSTSKKKFPDDFPRPLFSENNSLITWGATDNGDYLFWVYDINLKPNNWKMGVYDSRAGEESKLFDINMSTFLEKLVKNEIQTDAFPEDWLDMKDKKFE